MGSIITTEVFSTHAAAVVENESNRGQEKHPSFGSEFFIMLIGVLLIFVFLIVPVSSARAEGCEPRYFPWHAVLDGEKGAAASRFLEPCAFFDWESVTAAFYSSKGDEDFVISYLEPVAWDDAIEVYTGFAKEDDRHSKIKTMSELRQALEGQEQKDLIMKTHDVIGLMAYWVYASNFLRPAVAAEHEKTFTGMGSSDSLNKRWNGWGNWTPIGGTAIRNRWIIMNTDRDHLKEYIDWSRFPDWRTDEEREQDEIAYQNWRVEYRKRRAMKAEDAKKLRQLLKSMGVPE